MLIGDHFYIRPDFFDWGLYKSNGELILLLSMLFYGVCIVGSVLLLGHIGRRIRQPELTIFIGLVPVVCAGAKSFESIGLQLSSAHYQEKTHLPAVLMTLGTFWALWFIWIVIKGTVSAPVDGRSKKIESRNERCE